MIKKINTFSANQLLYPYTVLTRPCSSHVGIFEHVAVDLDALARDVIQVAAVVAAAPVLFISFYAVCFVAAHLDVALVDHDLVAAVRGLHVLQLLKVGTACCMLLLVLCLLCHGYLRLRRRIWTLILVSTIDASRDVVSVNGSNLLVVVVGRVVPLVVQHFEELVRVRSIFSRLDSHTMLVQLLWLLNLRLSLVELVQPGCRLLALILECTGVVGITLLLHGVSGHSKAGLEARRRLLGT